MGILGGGVEQGSYETCRPTKFVLQIYVPLSQGLGEPREYIIRVNYVLNSESECESDIRGEVSMRT